VRLLSFDRLANTASLIDPYSPFAPQ